MALDLTRHARRNLELLAAGGGLPGKRIVAGVVDGRIVWINDLADSAATLAVMGGPEMTNRADGEFTARQRLGRG